MKNIEKIFFNKSLLLILESPSKAKTISYILKKINIKKFKIVATKGHIKDLTKKNLGFKIENDKIIPFFNFLPGKKRIIDYIKKLLNQYNYVVLATDPDREGEAIAFHVYSELSNGLADNFKENSQQKLNFKRAFINEITLNGVKKGLENLSEINLSMVESQLARRIIDRVIGYKISPVLWRNFKIKGLSAGRVQTATLKILVQREKEIENFKPQKYFTIKINFKINEYNLNAYLYGKNGDLFKVYSQEEVRNLENSFLKKIVDKLFEFEMNEGVKEIIPPDPLKTSTLQQEAAKIGISNSLTMKIAQKLYEGVFIGKEKRGLITYHRTDSIRVSQEGIELAKKILGNVRVYNRKNKSAFDAHEAIRITYPFSLSLLRKYLSNEEFKIYELIYRRFLASLYLPCEYAYKEIVCCLSQDFYIKYQAGKV
ncbi:MAG: type IA DNA topoisomerase, partial [bacterium]